MILSFDTCFIFHLPRSEYALNKDIYKLYFELDYYVVIPLKNLPIFKNVRIFKILK